MRLFTRIVLLVAFSANTYGAEPALIGCPLQVLAELEAKGADRILVRASVNGVEGDFYFSPMSIGSVIWEPVAKKLGLPLAPGHNDTRLRLPLAGAHEPLAVNFARVQDLKLGKASFGIDLLISFAPSASSPPLDRENTFGILGRDVFGGVDYEIDLAHGKIRLFSAEHCPAPPVYWTNTYATENLWANGRPTGAFAPYFQMTLDGKVLETTLEPINPVTHIDDRITKAIYNFDEESPGLEQSIDDHGSSDARFRPMQLTADGISFNNERVQIRKGFLEACNVNTKTQHGGIGFRDCVGPMPLVLGVETLRKLRIYVAAHSQKIYFSTADATKP